MFKPLKIEGIEMLWIGFFRYIYYGFWSSKIEKIIMTKNKNGKQTSFNQRQYSFLSQRETEQLKGSPLWKLKVP